MVYYRERPLPPVSRSRHSFTLNISQTVRDTQFQWNTNRDLHTPYWTVSLRMTLSEPEWLSKIFNDTKRRGVSLRQLLVQLTVGTGQTDRRMDQQTDGWVSRIVRPPIWECCIMIIIITPIRQHINIETQKKTWKSLKILQICSH